MLKSKATCVWLILYSFSLIGLVASSANAQAAAEESPEPTITYGLESDIASRYVWRGLACSQAAVSQNSLWLSTHGLTGTLWGNYDFQAVEGTPSLNEVDFGIAYSFSAGLVSGESGIVACYYPNQTDLPWTSEWSVSLSLGTGPVRPVMSHTVDIKAYSGAYFGEVGLEFDQALGPATELYLLAGAGYGNARFNETYVGPSTGALQLLHVDAEFTVNLSNSWYVRPHAGYSWIGSQAIADWVEERSHFHCGIALGGDFAWAD